MEGMCLLCSSVCNINDTRDVYIQDNNAGFELGFDDWGTICPLG